MNPGAALRALAYDHAVDAAALWETLRVARAAERMKFLRPADWPDLAVALLLEDVEDPEIAELAGFDASVSDWTVRPLTEALYEKHGVPELDPEGAVECLAGLMAEDLRARPSVVTGPMIRLLARLAPPDFDSSLANRCYGAEEYLDCDCAGRVDPTDEAELERRPGPRLPDSVVQVLAGPLRSTLPLVQPPHAH
jgi:hypothetical protein